MSVRVAGVDGCRGGWVAAIGTFSGSRLLDVSLLARQRFTEILDVTADCGVVAVDMPIGLLDGPIPGGRECDRAARSYLGAPRSSSVFSPPSRSVLDARSFDEVRGRGMTIQAFHILPKIREVDAAMTSPLQKRVLEFHPEVAFKAIAGRAMERPKKRSAGRRERLAVLEAAYPTMLEAARSPIDFGTSGLTRVPKDDILDALVLVAAGWRKLTGDARPLPPEPPRDARGLRMEIWC